MLASDRLDRFARHIVLPEIGGAGQAALAKATVVLIGLGGIGSPALQYLAGAGVGTLVLVDDDAVDVSNLQRQTIYRAGETGRSKTELAELWVREFDPLINVRRVSQRVTRDNAATRLAVSDACVAVCIPLLSAAVGRFQGQVGAFAGHLPDQPCYRCYVGDAFDADDCDTCADEGMLGAMAGWAGTFAAMQAIRVLLDGSGGIGAPQWGKLHLLDGLKPGMRTLSIAKDPACKGCAR